MDALRQALKELGYIESKNIAFEYRWAGGKPDQLPELAAELARLKVDVMVTDGTPPAPSCQERSEHDPTISRARP